MSASARHSKRRQPGRVAVWLHRLGWAALGAVLLLTVLYASLQTAPVQRALVAYLNRTLVRSSYGVRLEGLSGRLPQRPCLRRITCADDQGPWLHIENARLAWSPLQWFQGQVTVDALTASQVTVLRRPVYTRASLGPSPTEETWSWIPQVTFTRLALNQVELHPAVLGRSYGFGVTGQARLASQLQGLDSEFSLSGDLAAGIRVRWRRDNASLTAGTVTLDIKHQQHRVAAHSAYALAGGTLGLSDLEISLPGINGRGALNVETASGLSAGTLRIDIQDAAPLSSLCAYPLQGQGAVEVRLSTEQGRQDAAVTWDIKNLKQTKLEAESLIGSADLRDLYNQVAGQVHLTGNTIQADAQTIKQLNLSAQGALPKGQISVEASGVYGEPFTCTGKTEWQHHDSVWDLAVQSAEINYGTHRVALRQPAALTVPAATFRSGPYRLQDWHVTADNHKALLTHATLNWSAPMVQVSGNVQFADQVPTDFNTHLNLPIQNESGSVAFELIRHRVPFTGKSPTHWLIPTSPYPAWTVMCRAPP